MVSKVSECLRGVVHRRLPKVSVGFALSLALCSEIGAQAVDVLPEQAVVASAYPTRPIKLMVPDTKGGVIDSIAATLAQHLGDKFGQYVLVDNLAGSREDAVAEATAQAQPDGYTLVISSHEGMILAPLMQNEAALAAIGDLLPVATLFSSTFYLMVNNWLRAKSVEELIKLAKAQPGKLTYTSSGKGSSDHLAAALFRQRAGIELRYVAHQGNTSAINDLLGGKVDIMFAAASVGMPHLQARRLRALASTSETRMALMPDVPTLSERLPGFSLTGWIGLFAPRGVPVDIVDKINKEVEVMLLLPATPQEFSRLGVETMRGTPEDFAALIKTDIPAWGQMLQEAGITPE